MHSYKAEELTTAASDYTVGDLVTMWYQFSKEEQQILFPILQQDCPPIKPSDVSEGNTQSDEVEPLHLYPHLGDNSIIAKQSEADQSSEPSEISLNIAMSYMYLCVSCNSSYSHVTDLTALAWMGIYKAKR